MGARYVADGLITGEGAEARLLGGKRKADGRVVFPLPVGPEAKQFDPMPLADRGVLWSYTVQRFQPKTPYKGPAEFTPYAVGYVELPGQIIVESRIETDDVDSLKIGMPMAFTVQTFRTDADGDVLTYAFRPA